MAVAAEILEFSNTCTPWQRDALRRIFTQVEFTPDDLNEAFALLKGEAGIGLPTALIAKPLTSAHIPESSEEISSVILNSVEDVLNTNRLATGQKLPFGIDGLTVVYGDNGSGKSGYCRILKKLCRVRDGGEEDIRSNAFEPASAASAAEATVRFSIGSGEPTSERWTDGSTPPSSLSRISVFDAKVGALYADQQNRIEFLPHGLDAMRKLGEVCEQLSALVDREKIVMERLLAPPLPAVPTGSPAEALLARLSTTTQPQDVPTESEIKASATWTADDERGLADTEKALHSDSAELAAKCKRLAGALAQLEADAKSYLEVFDDEAASAILNVQRAAIVAREAATLAANTITEAVPLAAFGSAAWRQMFEHARQYSLVAYPEVTDDDHKRVFFAMKRASTFSGHDRAQATQASAPSLDEVAKDIEILKTYVGELAARKKHVENRRKDLEKPAAGKTV